MSLFVFGGAFDPIHNGHLDIVSYLQQVASYDQLLIIPTGQPVHKKATFFSNECRLEMLSAVFDSHPLITICDYELQRKQPSYTVDTIDFIQHKYGNSNITLVVGFDQLYQFHRWRNSEAILSMCQLLVVLRQGIDHERLLNFFPNELVPFKHKISIHELYPTNISSTQIRIKIQKKQSISDDVPNVVLPIIANYLNQV